MNSWNYTEYIPVVPHYLINNYVYVYYDLYDIWSILPVPCDFDRKYRESCQLGNVFRAICYKFAGPNCLASVLKYFIIKGLKSLRNRTIGYMIFQCVLGFLVNNCVPMNTYMTRDPCENYMFTNSNKAFFK
jgi:hypothetical protein